MVSLFQGELNAGVLILSLPLKTTAIGRTSQTAKQRLKEIAEIGATGKPATAKVMRLLPTR
jgi:hypothetical protein